MGGAREVDAAARAAAAAFPAWRDANVRERAQVMFRFKRLLEEEIDELARGISAENGKTFGEAKAEVMKGIEVVEFATRAAAHRAGADRRSLGRHRLHDDAGADRRRRFGDAVQLPGDGAAVDDPDGAHGRQRHDPQAVGAGADHRAPPGAPARAGGPSGRRLQCRPRRPRRGRGDPRPAGDPCRLVRRLDPGRPRGLPPRNRARQARAGARRGQEPPDRDARRRPRRDREGDPRGRDRLRRSALHGGERASRGRRHRADARASGGARRADARRGRYGRDHQPRRCRPDQQRHRARRRQRRRARRRRPRSCASGEPRRRLLGRADRRRSRPEGVGGGARRDLRPGALGRARRLARRGAGDRERQRLRQRRRGLHRVAAPRRARWRGGRAPA